MNNNNIAIVATSHHSFAGGGKNKTRILHELAKLNFDVNYVGIKKPHLFEYTDTQVHINTITLPVADAFEDNGFLIEHSLSEKITEIALEKSLKKKVILWGSNLFPFVSAAFSAKCNVMDIANIKLPLIASPVGSDIWQIGPGYKHAVYRLLYSDLVNCRIAYTRAFADEIIRRYGEKKDKAFDIIPPILDTEKFFYIQPEEKEQLKLNFGLSADAIVIIHHSNMRPVKRPLDVIQMVKSAAENMAGNLILLMVGPYSRTLFDNCFPEKWEVREVGNIKIATEKNLSVYWTGLVSNVEDYIKFSDIAVNCSLHDSFNISLMEAMACGVPCISSNVVGIAPDILASGGGYLYETNAMNLFDLDKVILEDREGLPLNVDNAVAKLIHLIEDKAERQERGKNAAQYFYDHFAPKGILMRYQILFEELIDNANK